MGGIPPRIGNVKLIVEDGAILSEDRVDEVLGEVVRCFPEYTRRRSDGGIEVRRERSCLKVVMVVEEGIVRGIAGGILALVLQADEASVSYSLQKAA